MKRIVLLTTLSFALAPPSFAHDLYLTLVGKEICAGIGENFPESQNAITADRLNSFSLRRGERSTPLTGRVNNKRFCATADVQKPAVAEMTVQPRFIKLSPKDFASYTHGEGLREVERIRGEKQQKDSDGRELYSRYTKLLSGKLGELATRALGHVLEIVPETDPSELKAGDSLRVRVLFKGKPLPDAAVSAVYSGADLKGHQYPVATRTDANGMAELKLDRGGLWYARMIYMEPVQNDPEVDWRSYFATVTFTISSAR